MTPSLPVTCTYVPGSIFSMEEGKNDCFNVNHTHPNAKSVCEHINSMSLYEVMGLMGHIEGDMKSFEAVWVKLEAGTGPRDATLCVARDEYCQDKAILELVRKKFEELTKTK